MTETIDQPKIYNINQITTDSGLARTLVKFILESYFVDGYQVRANRIEVNESVGKKVIEFGSYLKWKMEEVNLDSKKSSGYERIKNDLIIDFFGERNNVESDPDGRILVGENSSEEM